MNLEKIGEFGLIKRIRKWIKTSNPDIICGIGDDVAIVEMGKKVMMITTDILIEGIHFNMSWIDPYRLGKKSLAVNLSDIAAMGGIPKYFLISMGIPKRLPISFISLFYRSLRREARRFKMDLIGGNTSLSQKIVINICLIGEGDKENIILRNGAKPGDDLYVSGTIGDSALGLRILQTKDLKDKPKTLIEKQLSPQPRIQLGQSLARNHLASAMIDISDGLLIDTKHILEESQVGARIWETLLPLSRQYRKWSSFYDDNLYDMALRGGEDYELLFSAPRNLRDKILSLSLSLKIPITRIGEILPKKEGLRIIRKDGKEYLPNHLGYDHFR